MQPINMWLQGHGRGAVIDFGCCAINNNFARIAGSNFNVILDITTTGGGFAALGLWLGLWLSAAHSQGSLSGDVRDAASDWRGCRAFTEEERKRKQKESGLSARALFKGETGLITQ